MLCENTILKKETKQKRGNLSYSNQAEAGFHQVRPRTHPGYFPPTTLIMKRMKIMAMNPAAEITAFVSAPDTAAARVRAANDMATMSSTSAASGD